MNTSLKKDIPNNIPEQRIKTAITGNITSASQVIYSSFSFYLNSFLILPTPSITLVFFNLKICNKKSYLQVFDKTSWNYILELSKNDDND